MSVQNMLILMVQSVFYQFYIVTFYIKWVTTSWTHSMSTGNREDDHLDLPGEGGEGGALGQSRGA